MEPELVDGPAGGLQDRADRAAAPVTFGTGAGSLVSLGLPRGPVVLSAPDLTVGTLAPGVPPAAPGAPNAPGVPVVSAGTVTYPQVAPDTDLAFASSFAGIAETVTLRSPRSPRSLRFHIADPLGQLGALTAMPDGSYSFANTVDGDPAGTHLGLAPPVAYTPPSASDPLGSGGQPGSASMTVARAGDGWDVVEAVSPGWLAQPATRWCWTRRTTCTGRRRWPTASRSPGTASWPPTPT